MIEMLCARNLKEKLNVILYIESAMAIMDLPDICNTAMELSASSPFQPVALVLGSDDLCASIGKSSLILINIKGKPGKVKS